MIKVSHVARSAASGKWQAFARRNDGIEAVFYAESRAEAVRAAVTWVGPEELLSAALDALEGLLETINARA